MRKGENIMLILLFIIFVVLFILGSIFIDKYHHEFSRFVIQSCTACGAIVALIAFIFVACNLSEIMVIDEKIAMYTEENKNIEKQIDTIISEYMEYESGTFEKLKSNSSITLVSLYPELKSDELVQSQIATYQANNAKLKELKELKINCHIYKWWLYFGK